MTALLCRFERIPPPHETPQARALDWLALAHAEAERARSPEQDTGALAARLRKLIERFGCGPDRIARRGHFLAELTHTRWDEMTIYPVRRSPRGADARTRTEAFARAAWDVFQRAYPEGAAPPADIVHVTCTGYVSPSAAQRLVAARRWETRVTHAYHMGCYAAVPAVRIAMGLAALEPAIAARGETVDIVHTELCSLHVDPSDHAPEQLVVQSLFADGAIRYSIARATREPSLRVLAIEERVLPDSADAMRWIVSGAGMQMGLAREVPDRVGGAARPFVEALLARAGDAAARAPKVFAVHPGGPKIIDRVQAALELDDAQVDASRAVLRDHGNMSSATLPHVWMRILEDARVPDGALVVSLAFGPGLTVCGALLRKEAA